MTDKYNARAKAIAETINASTFSSNEQFVEKCRHLISSGLRNAAAREREECAKICESHQAQHEMNQRLANQIGINIAKSIRSRGNSNG